MPSLVVRKLDDDLVLRLKQQARRHGRSAEAEHRAILEQALRCATSGEELLAWLSRGRKLEVDFGAGVDPSTQPADFGPP